MHRTDKYSQHTSLAWQAWLNGSVFVYKLSGCGFKSSTVIIDICLLMEKKIYKFKAENKNVES